MAPGKGLKRRFARLGKPERFGPCMPAAIADESIGPGELRITGSGLPAALRRPPVFSLRRNPC